LQVKEIKTMTVDEKIDLGIVSIPQDSAIIPVRKTTRVSNQVWVASTGKTKGWILEQASKEKEYGWKPLRIRITGIRKERLLDITEADAKKEGFEDKVKFRWAFEKINKKSMPIECKTNIGSLLLDWNPEVWVLEFEVKK